MINYPKMNAAIFDMDGTLVNSLMYWNTLWESVGRDWLSVEGFRPTEEIDKKVRTMIFTQAMAYVNEACGINADEDKFVKYATDNLESFYRNVVTVKEGAREFLEYLRGKGIKLCLASATDMKYVIIALDVLDLRKYFDAVMSCADIGVGKDKPDIYLLALKSLGTAAEETYIFEDSFVALETARAIGLNTVGVFDEYNFDHDRLARASMIYLGEETDMRELIGVL